MRGEGTGDKVSEPAGRQGEGGSGSRGHASGSWLAEEGGGGIAPATKGLMAKLTAETGCGRGGGGQLAMSEAEVKMAEGGGGGGGGGGEPSWLEKPLAIDIVQGQGGEAVEMNAERMGAMIEQLLGGAGGGEGQEVEVRVLVGQGGDVTAQLEDLPAPFREMIEALNGQSIGALARRPAGEGEEEEEEESVD
mmetsp:Transcript_21121/g.66104  ORF Transcript_21121/g.66104 Transcript_21121/m.66104 type:complete len:192 (+) Transcript_21121:107-682(+)